MIDLPTFGLLYLCRSNNTLVGYLYAFPIIAIITNVLVKAAMETESKGDST